MSSFDGYSHLKNISPTTTDEDIKNLYDKWANNWQEDSATFGYMVHKPCSEFFEAEMERLFQDGRFNQKILDAGAGTGYLGQHLKDLGYTDIDGLDISQEMLNIALKKGIYKNLICAPISEKKIDQIQTGQYDALISSGTITVAHVKPPALDEIVRLVKPGGIICFTIRQDAYDTESMGYKKKIDELASAKKWEMLNKKSVPYHDQSGIDSELQSGTVFSFRVL